LGNKALAIATLKIRDNNAVLVGRKLGNILYSVISVGMYENWVELKMRALMNQRTGANGKARVHTIAGFKYPGLTTTPLSDEEDRSPRWNVFGGSKIGLLLEAARYFDPSITPNRIAANKAQMQKGFDIGTAGLNKEP
jgi:hypothetical protein